MKSEEIIISNSSKNTYDFGVQIAKGIKNGIFGKRRLVCLQGILGSGKTVFAKGFLKEFGITTRILSPTFTISKTYEIQEKTIWHFDLYRMLDASDAMAIGMKEVLSDANAIVLIEWSEKISEFLPSKRIDVRIEVIGDTSREIVLNVLG
ncbi:tRNA (adenosine(37)-N6)-threonylcarbamoyltransferase complex ATPase subunit type 1 TsaE [Candidatus Gottesmanbacteria bacterium]|nr:tRNA (adenosine(37)-N6)-threonylcarbamoyltransferase complex ATPase subunit type 1 TsaE [Candidatus Gottesmanbacteria bacterium]